MATVLGRMDAQTVQAFLARVLATTPAFQSPAFWGGAAAQTPAASASASSSAYGYPGQGANANIAAGDAAQAYATMMQLAEQCRLAAVAESMLSPATQEEQLFQRVREAVRQELATQNVNADKPKEKPKVASKETEDEGAAEATLAHNRTEAKLHADREEFEAERLKETRELDRRAIDFARAAFKKEQADQEVRDAKNSWSFVAPTPKSRAQLRSVGGYRVQGGVLEVFTRFRPDGKDFSQKNETATSEKNPEEEKPAAKEDEKKKDPAELRPRSPDHPPRARDKRPYAVNPPPPPVDIYKKEEKHLDSCYIPNWNQCVTPLVFNFLG